MGETLASSQIRVWNLRTVNEGTAGRYNRIQNFLRVDTSMFQEIVDRLTPIMQLINFGAVIAINTSRVQVNYPDAT